MCKLSDIKDVFGFFNELNIWRYLKDIGYFVFSPRKFWENWDGYSTKERYIQGTLYGTIALLILLCTGIGDTWSDRVGVLLLNFFVSMPFFLCVLLSAYITMSNRTHDAIVKIIVFCVYMFFIVTSLQTPFFKAYVKAENYLYLALANGVSILAEYYLLFIPMYVFEPKIRRRVYYVIAMIVSMSLIDIAATKLEFYSSSMCPEIATDFITKERYELGQSLRAPYVVPQYAITFNKSGDTQLTYVGPNDMEITEKISTSEYIEALYDDMDSLQVISKRARFRTNKEFFNAVYSVKRECLKTYETKSYLANKTLYRKILIYNDNPVDSLDVRYFNEECIVANNQLFQKDMNYSNAYSNAMGVLYLRCLYRPYILYTYIKEYQRR